MLSAAVPFQGKPDEGRVLEALRKLIGDDDSPGMLVLTVQRKPKPVGYGPGTELKKMLATIGITAEPGCKCNARAAEMDRMEKAFPGWCEANIDLIVGWLRETQPAVCGRRWYGHRQASNRQREEAGRWQSVRRRRTRSPRCTAAWTTPSTTMTTRGRTRSPTRMATWC